MNSPAGQESELACVALGQPFQKQQKWVSELIHLHEGLRFLFQQEENQHNPSVAMPDNYSVGQNMLN